METQDNCPNHTKNHLKVAIDKLFGSNANQLNTLVSDEFEALAGVLDLVDPHGGLLVQLLHLVSGNHFQELSQLDTIREISADFLYARAEFSEVRVDPCSEGFLLGTLPGLV